MRAALIGCSVTDGHTQPARPCSNTAINIITVSKLSLRPASAPSGQITSRSADGEDSSPLLLPLRIYCLNVVRQSI